MLLTVSDKLYEAARLHAVSLNRTKRGRIVVSGADRASYLQGLLTNDIVALKAGEGCYAAYLTAQGRMITDLYVYEIGDIIILSMELALKDLVLARFEQFLFSEDVQLGDVTSTFAQLAVIGPEAARAVSSVLDNVTDGTLEALPEHGNLRATTSGQPVIVTKIADTGEPGYDLYVDRAEFDRLRARLASDGIPDLDGVTAEAIRIEAGVPRFTADMNEETIPLEAGIEGRAINFNKGCYVGQEVIIRVLHRGHGRVARKLVGLVFEGAAGPPPGTTLLSGDREIGVVTSSTISPRVGKPIALGYVQRDFVEAGTAVSTREGQAGAVAELPFASRQKPD